MFVFSMAALLVAGWVFGSGICEEDTTLVYKTLVAPAAYSDSTNTIVGNYFPWTTNTSYFSTFRNQFLYPATVFPSEARTIESISARSVSFLGSQVGVYEDNRPNGWQYLQILAWDQGNGPSVGPPLSLNFRQNRLNSFCAVDFMDNWNSAFPPYYLCFVPTMRITTNGRSDISHACFAWCPSFYIDWDADPANNYDFMLDSGMDLTPSGHSGNVAWDVGQQQDAWRAYGSSSIYNTQWVTQAYGIDDMVFVWVFCGLSAPPPATLDANIKEIVRLLLTPEAMRCSDLDTNPNLIVKDEPIMFPHGKDIDPVSPQITTQAPLHMEEEQNPYIRKRNFRP
jgi:hypothetical protein